MQHDTVGGSWQYEDMGRRYQRENRSDHDVFDVKNLTCYCFMAHAFDHPLVLE